MSSFEVVVGAGSLRSTEPDAVPFKHQWTSDGVTVQAGFTGAHLLHLAVAGCVLNDLYREARPLGMPLDGVRVRATGDFDQQSWQSLGIEYSVEIVSSGSPDQVAALVDRVEAVAEIPQAVRQGTTVTRVSLVRSSGGLGSEHRQ